MYISPLRSAALVAGTLLSAQVLAVDVNSGDYTALPAGTNLALWYQQYGRSSSFTPDRGPDSSNATSLKSNISILRLIHYMELGDILVAPQVILPFGHVYDAKIGGYSLGSASGLADPILGAAFWLVNQPNEGASGRYAGFTPLIHLPFGSYDKSDVLNLGENRYKFDLQMFWVEPLLGKSSLELHADAVLYGDNDEAGNGSQTFEQDPTYQLQANLRYDFNPAQRVALGYSTSTGGKQYLDGNYTGQKTEVQQVRAEFQQMVGRTVQLSAQLTHDINVVGGFQEDLGVNLRALLLF
ncbi:MULTISPECIES: transporter [Pseudomonas]